MAFEVEFTNEQVSKMLTDMNRRVDDFKHKRKPVLGLLSANIFADIMEHFQHETGETSRWKKWSDSYDKAMKARGRGGNKILQDSGRLRQTFKPTSYRVMGDGVMWYNNAKTKDGAPYAYYHNEGGKKLPKREFMWLSQRAMSKIESELLQFIAEGK